MWQHRAIDLANIEDVRITSLCSRLKDNHFSILNISGVIQPLIITKSGAFLISSVGWLVCHLEPNHGFGDIFLFSLK